MRRVDIKKTSLSLVRFARLKEPTMFTDDGKDVAVLYPVPKPDKETVALLNSEQFMEIIRQSRAHTKAGEGISSDDMRRRFGIKKSTRRPRTRTAGIKRRAAV